MQIILTIKDRVTLGQLYPQLSNFADQILSEDISKKTRVSQETLGEIEFKTHPTAEGFSYEWNNTKAEGKELTVDFTDMEISFLRKQIDTLDKTNQISRGNFEICKKIRNAK